MKKLIAAVLLPLLSACSTPQPPRSSAADSTYMLHDRRDAAAIGDAYHERVRLGLGSPFRIIEIAAHDTRLPAAQREELLADLFERVEDGDSYQTGATLPLAHYRVIEHALNSTHDPRIAELAVNLAYEAAVTENTVTRELQYAAAGTVALMRDRALARHDARHVRAVARTHDLEPHTLVPAMRAQRALLVEQPLQPALNAEAQEAASKLALLLVGGVRQAARAPVVFTARQAKTSALPRDVAERILALQRAQERPPQSALIVAMRAAQLPFHARDEETFVAELALHDEHARLAAQRAAIALRPFAQERIWHQQAKTPTAAELLARYGVRLVFLDDVPARWQPYYRFLLDDALADLQLAVPGLNLAGLTIEIGDVPAGAPHLAYHDPRARSIRWAPATGGGSLAHEIAHDLDWQIARRSYGRFGYASDLGGEVAAMLLLTAGEAAAGERATEVFARQFDWVAAAALAGQGRMNGQLSSVQHDWLPGHGSARPPLANSRSANALAGMVARGGRLGEAGKREVARAVRADALPSVVHAVRQLRHGTERPAGPRRSAFETMSQTATAEYVGLLARLAGIGLAAPDAGNSGITIDPKGPYVVQYY